MPGPSSATDSRTRPPARRRRDRRRGRRSRPCFTALSSRFSSARRTASPSQRHLGQPGLGELGLERHGAALGAAADRAPPRSGPAPRAATGREARRLVHARGRQHALHQRLQPLALLRDERAVLARIAAARRPASRRTAGWRVSGVRSSWVTLARKARSRAVARASAPQGAADRRRGRRPSRRRRPTAGAAGPGRRCLGARPLRTRTASPGTSGTSASTPPPLPSATSRGATPALS